MSWFKEHLNWTYILAFLFVMVANAVLVGIMSSHYANTGNRAMDWLLYVDLAVWIFGLLVVPVWVIRQKGRSLWYLFCYCVGILPIVVLCLKNKREATGEQEVVCSDRI